MKIAIPVNEDSGLQSTICEHFGHTPYFAFVNLEKDEIKAIKIIVNPFENHAPGEVPGFVKENGAQVMVARGMGGRAVSFFEQFGIQVVKGVDGNVENIINRLVEGKLISVDSYEPSDKSHDHNC